MRWSETLIRFLEINVSQVKPIKQFITLKVTDAAIEGTDGGLTLYCLYLFVYQPSCMFISYFMAVVLYLYPPAVLSIDWGQVRSGNTKHNECIFVGQTHWIDIKSEHSQSIGTDENRALRALRVFKMPSCRTCEHSRKKKKVCCLASFRPAVHVMFDEKER